MVGLGFPGFVVALGVFVAWILLLDVCWCLLFACLFMINSVALCVSLNVCCLRWVW